ncbi:sulfite exporter TauE/SafE family protein [Rickettsiales endosymbiont of Stachyamoeba lipophora]|uniref:sulfite exporter TauE/SafE family protein n=1 Tax=Rickettsiales endosymbiont of Stachyamoeba lipophora TaxID=2486578 RepID=UPI000F64D39B|nr:sulfite exporter TauE/SafE family protein [Rickettsiales endosymbiont of Stachyamoeba lipophora]AZL16251.1 sulfite exporter TauE/SafE family protein [Rickettsiales endosymbiont of Stachyamoeba lipophora]
MVISIGYVASLVMGLILGLTGAGGAILAVPILTYLFFIPAIKATSYSLVVISCISLVGIISYHRQSLVKYKLALILLIPSIIAVFLTREYLLPIIPNVLFKIGSFTATKNKLILLAMSMLMLNSALSMLRSQVATTVKLTKGLTWVKIILMGLLIGFFTGMLGVGGGFLILPLLISHFQLNMKQAAATSLFVIMVNSSIALIIDIKNFVKLDYWFLSKFTFCALIGMLIATFIIQKIPQKLLKISFALVLIILSSYIISRETLLVI